MKVIEIFNSDGTASKYKKLSARLPQFLEKYPVGDGWRVVAIHKDPLELRPQLLDLWRAALEKGFKPNDLGLPPLPFGGLLVETQLINPQGEVVRNASSFGKVQGPKDWEIVETNSLQRLLARLGMGGDLLDTDEQADIQAGSSQMAPIEDVAPDTEPVDTLVDEKDETGKEPDPLPTPPPPLSPAMVKEPAPTAAKEEKGDGVPDYLLAQLKHQAGIRNLPVPEVKTVGEAQMELMNLLMPQSS